MTDQPLTGVWTYRSFANVPDPVDDFDDLRLDQGELVFEAASAPGTVRGQLAFRSSPPQEADRRFTLVGSVGDGGAFAVRLRGTGVTGTSASGTAYEYVGHYVPGDPTGADSRPTVVGTVTRLALGGGRSAEAVGSFVAVQRDFPEPRTVPTVQLPDAIRVALAAKSSRLHHMVWHAVRLLWVNPLRRPPLSDTGRQGIRDLGWQPGGSDERPAWSGTGPFVRNGSGEDFLFMHRGMVQDVNARMHALDKPPIAPWPITVAPAAVGVEPNYAASPVVLPTPGNPTGFSVPPSWIDPTNEVQNSRYARVKSDDYYWSRMLPWDQEFKNPRYLATLTLGELGTLIEFGIHADIHRRWASIPRRPGGEPEPGGRDDADIRDLWDDPDYDHLEDFYSSHVNPVFWRFHGWIDRRIDDWYQAHEAAHPGEVVTRTAQSMGQNVTWFEVGNWVQVATPWTGPEQNHDGHGHHGGHDHDVEVLKQVMAIMFGASPPEVTERSLTPGVPDGSPTGQRRRSHLTYPHPEA